MMERAVLEEQHHLSDALYGLITQLSTEHDPATLLRLVLQGAQSALELRQGWAFLVQGQRLQPLPAPPTADWQAALQSELEALSAPLCAAQTPRLLNLNGAARVLVPLCWDQQALGLLLLGQEDSPAFFTPLRQRFLHKLALQGASAIAQAQLVGELRQSETRFRRLFHDSPVGMAVLDRRGQVSDANGALLELLGFSRQELLSGELNWLAQTPSGRGTEEAAFQQALEQGSSGHYEKTMRTRAGEQIALDVVLRPHADDQQRMVVYLRDLRDQQSRESRWQLRTSTMQGQLDDNFGLLALQAEQLQKQTAELEARTSVLEGFATLTRDLTLETDPYLLIEQAQQFALTLLPPGAFAVYYEPEGELWRLKAQVGDLGSPALQSALDAGLPFEGTTNLLLPWQAQRAYYQDAYDAQADTVADATTLLQSTATLPVLVRGKRRGIFGIGLNTRQAWTRVDKVILETAVKHLGLALERAEQAQSLQQRTLALERSNCELEQFAYIASHDLQEPLRTVTSFAELLVRRLSGLAVDEKSALYAGYITAGTKRMQALIQDLLSFSRVSIHPGALRPTDVAAVLSQVQQDLYQSLQDTQGQLIFGPTPAVLGDAAQLRQLFQNLIGNALKFHAPGRAPQISVQAQREGQWVRFRVADNGIGIEAEYFERIFTAFQRLHSREQYPGNGIGLAIVRKIVEHHGGEISLYSQPGEGTVFSLTLPLAPQKP